MGHVRFLKGEEASVEGESTLRKRNAFQIGGVGLSGFTFHMARLSDIITFIDQELRVGEIPDYSGAHNGLQLENNGEVTKVVAAVDASLPVIEKAIAANADLLLVHHGMFWQDVRPLKGAFYQKIKMAMDANLAIYSAHLPLDIHPALGNNVLLAKAIGLEVTGTFMEWKGIELGLSGKMDLTLGELKTRLGGVLNGPILSCGTERAAVGKVGIITGGAGSQVEEVAKQGIQTFITGEGPHWSHPLAEELGLNFLYGGHYLTEIFGIRKLGQVVSASETLGFEFIEHPTGL